MTAHDFDVIGDELKCKACGLDHQKWVELRAAEGEEILCPYVTGEPSAAEAS